MAKKKTKKSSNLGMILKVVVLVLGVAALAMAFLTAVNFLTSEGEVYKAYTGFNSMFGFETTTESVLGNVTTKYLGFSIMSTIAFVLPVIGAVLACLKNKMVRLIGAALMIVGAVLIFLVPTFTVLATNDGNLTIASALLDACDRGLGIGAILGGVFAALGGAVAGYAVLTKK